MYKFVVDVAMTRRKLFCFVLDEDDTLLWSGQRIGDGLDWLTDQGHTKVDLDTGDGHYLLTFQAIAK